MIEPLPSAPGELVLGRQAEEEWRRLRRQMELAEGFWLGFLFCDASVVADAFRERVRIFGKHRARSLAVLRPKSGDELVNLLQSLLDGSLRGSAVVWVEGAVTRLQEPPWRRGWEQFFLRLNERRDSLRRTLGCGVVLAAGTWVKPLARDAAPDLWSVRSIVLEPRPAEGPRVMSVAVHQAEPQPVEIAAEPSRPQEPLAPADEERARELLKRAEGLIATERAEEAVTAATDAVALLRRGAARHLHLADALWVLARAEDAAGDAAAAEEHARVAIAQASDSDDWRRIRALDLLGRLALRRRDLSTARWSYQEILGILDHELAVRGESPNRLRSVSVAQERLGNVLIQQGDLAGALALYEESVAVARRLLSELGDSPERLRDLSLSLDRVGDVLRQQDDLGGALAACEESLALRRRLLSELGDSPERLRDLSWSLEKVGDVLLQQGDLGSALSWHEESLALRRRLLSEHGDSLERLRDFASILEKMARVAEARGERGRAAELVAEAVALVERLVQTYGETPPLRRTLDGFQDWLATLRSEPAPSPR